MNKLSSVEVGIKIIEKSFSNLLKYIKPGQTELEVARFLKKQTKDYGSEGQAFKFIVASGKSASGPHHKPKNKKIKKGEMVVIDFGVKVSGYCTDLTRTVFIGSPSRKQEQIYNIVLKSQELAINAVRSGAVARRVDNAARRFIVKSGYGNRFIHTTGHGVGKRIHEAPKLGPKNNRRLEEGQIVTIEPGVYIKEWGGIRIEDMLLVLDKKSKILTNKIPKLVNKITIR